MTAESDSETIPRRPTIVWLGLVAATFVTYGLATRHPFAATSGKLAAAVAIGVGIAKAAFIGLEFMEIRGAPRALRFALLAWCAAVGGGCILLLVG